ncbi:MAG TPA: hypothetical protein IAB46_00900 [Candidatus Scybalocola faecigallinarum]|uniref:DNA binding HTH domain-containing protein n=1 Tax=Candidatus Scybalocola faecigallinarum TaxID=2840941 RepID=A0A9D1F1W1_9FIRM|nr:hypothetical protein [Candidatus Scybalocola faecigallinarum]
MGQQPAPVKSSVQHHLGQLHGAFYVYIYLLLDGGLEKFHNDKDKVCQYLGISRTTLWRKLKAGASSPDRP